MKRVPLSAKKTTLKDILAEDNETEVVGGVPENVSEIENKNSEKINKISEKVDKKTDIRFPKSDIEIPNAEIINTITDIVIPKSDILDQTSEIENSIGGAKPSIAQHPISENGNTITDIGNAKPGKGDKSEFLKVTATLEPKLLWLLEDERRRRRVAKLEYTFSEIIREALTEYFIKQGREV
ncbi:MAG: hypothetical protein HXX11_14560 [Desulfuromonadales bacterium]|nr:hypothetical protein [Desulfuromonadales bacterium]